MAIETDYKTLENLDSNQAVPVSDETIGSETAMSSETEEVEPIDRATLDAAAHKSSPSSLGKIALTADGAIVLTLSSHGDGYSDAVLTSPEGRITVAGNRVDKAIRYTFPPADLAALMPSGLSNRPHADATATLPIEIWTANEPRAFLASGVLPIAVIARSVRMAKSKFANLDLQALRGEPQIRGVVEEFGKKGVRGWAVDAATFKPVSLSLELEGFPLTTIETDGDRPDIAEVTGLTISAGFTASASALRRGAPAGLINLLTLLDADHPDYLPEFRVVAAGADYVLPVLVGTASSLSSAAWLKLLRVDLSPAKSPLVAKAEMVRKLAAQQSAEAAVKLIAFYLPQYHPTAENDAWWGPGFTEWSNVSVSKPQFEGHYQPHLPADLGFYDLRLDETRKAQAELARQYGVHGFCYYYYWFSGRRILEKPLQAVLESGEPDFPFCICWANESWSRRWDGSEAELLIAQEHDPEKDAKFIDDILPLIKDPRYITVNGEPLLIIYRVGLLPEPKRVFEAWKATARANGLPGLHICMAETFGAHDPHRFGCDSAVEFPPHKTTSEVVNKDIPDLPSDYTGNIYEYQQVIQNDLLHSQPASYTRYRTVMPSWDNTARRGKAGNAFLGSTPELYETWLQQVVADTKTRFAGDQRLVFVNAWNEWAEGAHLEPDRRYGRRYLEATRRAVVDQSDWRALLDGLRMRGQIAPADMEEAIQALETRFSGLQSSVDFLSRKLKDPVIAWGQSVFTTKTPATLANKPVIPAGQIEIDRVNQYWSEKWHVLRRGEHLSLEGWSFVPGVELEASSNSFLTLISTEGGPTCYGVTWDRHQRPDVVTGTGAPAREALWSGFRITASLKDVPPGEYVVAMSYSARELTYRASSRNRLVIA